VKKIKIKIQIFESRNFMGNFEVKKGSFKILKEKYVKIFNKIIVIKFSTSVITIKFPSDKFSL
jgi:hypothetical protein